MFELVGLLGCGGVTQLPCGPLHAATELDRAMTICLAHEAPRSWRTEPPSHEWDAPWLACRKVWAAWQQSEAARHEREYRERVERDRAFVDELARGLK